MVNEKYPTLAEHSIYSEFHPTKNVINPTTVRVGAKKKVWWLGKCGHEWEAVISNRVLLGSGCPFCAGKKVLTGFNDFLTHYPNIASQWHPIKNGQLLPSQVMKLSNKKVWWQCKLGHEWEARAITIVMNNKRVDIAKGCPTCYGKKVLAGFNDLESQHPSIAAEWHPTKNSPLAPAMVTAYSNKKAWWQCKLGHEWEAVINSRTNSGRFDKCPTCSGRTILVGFNDFGTTHPKMLEQWHPTRNGALTPEKVTKGSGQRVWWNCTKGHAWITSIGNRTGYNTGCPLCKSSQAEQNILAYVIGLLPDEAITHCERNVIAGKELDIYLPNKRIAIEYNGLYWHSEKKLSDKNYHHNKWKACQDQGIQLIQIWEDEWLNKPEIVKSMLAHKLGASTSPKIAGRKTQVEEVSTEVARDFFNAHHIQGFAGASRYLALTVDSAVGQQAGIATNTQSSSTERTVVAMIALRVEQDRLTKHPQGNIVRYATNAQVMGGFSKLLAYIERNLDIESLYTFSDNCISDGALYSNTGFKAVKNLDPDYMYIHQGVRKHKFGYRLERFKRDPNLLYAEGLTERDLALLNGLSRIWDAGKIKWERKVPPSGS